MFRSFGIGTYSSFLCLAHVLVGEPASTPDQVRGWLSPDHALEKKAAVEFIEQLGELLARALDLVRLLPLDRDGEDAKHLADHGAGVAQPLLVEAFSARDQGAVGDVVTRVHLELGEGREAL